MTDETKESKAAAKARELELEREHEQADRARARKSLEESIATFDAVFAPTRERLEAHLDRYVASQERIGAALEAIAAALGARAPAATSTRSTTRTPPTPAPELAPLEVRKASHAPAMIRKHMGPR